MDLNSKGEETNQMRPCYGHTDINENYECVETSRADCCMATDTSDHLPQGTCDQHDTENKDKLSNYKNRIEPSGVDTGNECGGCGTSEDQTDRVCVSARDGQGSEKLHSEAIHYKCLIQNLENIDEREEAQVEVQTGRTSDTNRDIERESSREERRETTSDWLLLCAALVYNVVVGLESTSFGVLLSDISQYFEVSHAAVGWTLGLEYFTCAMFSILASYPIRRFGCRLPCVVGSLMFSVGLCGSALARNLIFMYLCYGLIAGVGLPLSIISSSVIIQQRFNKHRALANSIASIGYSVGSITGPLVTRSLLSSYGWSGALLLMGAIQAHRIPLALVFKTPRVAKDEKSGRGSEVNEEKQRKTGNQENEYNKNYSAKMTATKSLSVNFRPQYSHSISVTSTVDSSLNIQIIHSPDDATHKSSHGFLDYIKDALDFSLLKNLRFLLLITSQCLMVFTFGYIAYLPGKGVRSGMTMSLSVWSLSLMSLTALVAKLVITFLSTCHCMNRLLVYCTTLTCGSLSMISLLLVPAPLGVFLSAILFGCMSSSSAINSVLLVDLMGVKLLARCISIQFFITGFFRLSGAPFVGWVYDITGDYDCAFLVFAVVNTVSVTLMLVLYCLVRRSSQTTH